MKCSRILTFIATAFAIFSMICWITDAHSNNSNRRYRSCNKTEDCAFLADVCRDNRCVNACSGVDCGPFKKCLVQLHEFMCICTGGDDIPLHECEERCKTSGQCY